MTNGLTRLGALTLFPLAGGLALWGAWVLGGPFWRAMHEGRKLEGEVVGMWVQREKGAELIGRMEVEVTLETAAGAQVRLEAESGGVPPRIAVEGPLEEEARPRLESLARRGRLADNAEILRILRRELRRKGEDRVVRLEKVERVWVTKGLEEEPEGLVVRDGVVLPEQGAVPARWETRAVFAQDPKSVRPNPVQREFVFRVDGVEAEAGRKDFVLYRDPWSTEFRPVVQFEEGGQRRLALSDIGRHGKPALGFSFFNQARVTIHPGTGWPQVDRKGEPDDPGMPPMERLSLKSEMIFSRWAHPLILLAVGVVSWVLGGIVLSLYWMPPAPTPTPGSSVGAGAGKRG